MEIVLDGREMTSREAAHRYLVKALSLPAYYGGNLDALYDCLTERKWQQNVLFVHTEPMIKSLGRYGELILLVFEESAVQNDSFHVIIEP